MSPRGRARSDRGGAPHEATPRSGATDDRPASVRDSAEPGLQTARLTHLVGYAAARASIQMRKTFIKHLGPLQLKVVDFSILVLIAANPNLNQKQLGAALGLSAPNLAVLLDRLAERGLVERVRSSVDRRAQHLHLTPGGSELTAQAEAIAATMENESLRVLSGAERALLIELLLKVARGRAARC